MIELHLVYQSGTLARLTELSLDQAAEVVQRYPTLHIFYTENGAT